MTVRVEELTTDAEWDRAITILKQLWPEEPEPALRRRRAAEYHLLGLYADGALVGVAGIRPLVLLEHERTAWVHDLVVDEGHRSQGYGGRLLDAAEAWAAERDFEALGLVSHRSNDEATEFYEEHMDRFGSLFYRDL